MTGLWRRAAFAALLFVGLTLIATGWVLEGADFGPGLLLELGAGLLLFALLFFVEARLRKDLSDLRRDVAHQRTSLEAIRSLSRDLVGEAYGAIHSMFDTWATELHHQSVWSLMHLAQSVGAVTSEGIRVYLPGPERDRWLAIRAEGTPEYPRIAFAVEREDRTAEATYEWHADRSPADAVRDLFGTMQATGAEWMGFDAAYIFERALAPIRVGLEARYRVAGRNFDLERVVEVIGGQWAITEEGLESTTQRYRSRIHWWRLWELDWVDHMNNKSWVDIDDFVMALHHAQGYFASRRADVQAEYERHSPSAIRQDN